MMDSKKYKKLWIRRGDEVQITCGKDKGSVGKILKVIPQKMKVYVEGFSMQKKHMKPNPKNQKGGIVSVEGPIHYSNVLLYCKKSKKGERIRIQQNKDGSKTRVFTQSGTSVDS